MAVVTTTTYEMDIATTDAFTTYFVDDAGTTWNKVNVGHYDSLPDPNSGLYASVFSSLGGVAPNFQYHFRVRTKTTEVTDGILTNTTYSCEMEDATKQHVQISVAYLIDISTSAGFSSGTFVEDVDGILWEARNVGYKRSEQITVLAGVYYSRVRSIRTILVDGATIVSEYGSYSKPKLIIVEPGTDTTTDSRIFIETTGSSTATWKELTRTITAKVNQPTPLASSDGTVDIDTIFEDEIPLTLGTDTLKNWIVYNSTKAKYAYITSSDAGSFTSSYIYFGSDGLGFQNNDDLVFYEYCGQIGYSSKVGVSPHVRFSPIETQRKANILLGTSSDPPTMSPPVAVCSRSVRNLFPSGTSTYHLELPSGFYLENGSRGLDPSFVSAPDVAAENSPSTFNHIINDWMTISVARYRLSGSDTWMYTKMYVTLMYGGYQESDPVFEVSSHVSELSNSITMDFNINIDPSLMPKEISGIRVYAFNVVNPDETTYVAEVLAISDSDFKLYKTITLNAWDGTAWTVTNTQQKCMTYHLTHNGRYNAVEETSILDNLGHAIDKARTYLTPRYSARPKRAYGASVIVDQSDSILRVSSYDGDGVHEDDNFPDVAIDNSGGKQKIFLTGDGALMGIAVLNENALAFKQTSLEIIDLQGANQRNIPIDCISKNSILSCDLGVFWAGKSALYAMAHGSDQVTVINESWKNYYDGTLKASDGYTPFIDEYSRQRVMSGYDLTYREVWFNMRVVTEDGTSYEYLNFRVGTDGQWNVRKLNLSDSVVPDNLVGFSRRKDATMSIIYPYGILSYPNSLGDYQYQERVSSDDTQSGEGFETSIRLQLGSLSGMMRNIVPHSIAIDFVAQSDNATDSFSIKLYANRESSAYDTQTFLIEGYPSLRAVATRGGMEQLSIEISIPPTNDLSSYKKFDVSSVTLMYAENKRIGNL